ncbi:MAG: S41 family peptidase [Bacteroidales bacterium]
MQLKHGPYFLGILLLISACEPDNNNTNPGKTSTEITASRIRGEIYADMQAAYLWNDKIPSSVDTTADVNPEQFFYNLLYTALDRWSFIVTLQEFNNLNNGIFYGHGIMFTYDEYANIRVGYVFKNTWASAAGIQRGWILKKVNGNDVYSYDQLNELVGDGTAIVTNQFEFIDNQGRVQNISLQKERITINPILASSVIDIEGKKIGYLALESFLGSDIEGKLDDVFSSFNYYSIDELVVDLRYNTGGSLSTANHLANLIIGRQANQQLFIRETFNPDLDPYIEDSLKTTYLAKKPNSLIKQLTRVFFITTGQTASASEALIKGIQPYLVTYLIGTRTYGKPVGMIPLEIKNSDYIIVPVMFEWKNALGESSGYAGIGVNYAEFDDLTHTFGDTSELCLRQAIHFIRTGSFIPRKKSATEIIFKKPNWQGIRAEIGAY